MSIRKHPFDYVSINVVENGYEVRIDRPQQLCSHVYVFETFENLTDWLLANLAEPQE